MRDYQIHSLSIQETNTKWTKHLQQRVHHVFQNTFLCTALSTSNSTEPSDTYQPSGTALTIVGPHASWLLSSGQDSSGMGRWSYIELLGKHNKCLILASAYCVRSQTAHIGSNMVSTQQTQILLQSGQHHPRPRTQLINDLIHQIQQWQLTGHEILVCLDANKDTANPNPEKGYGKILHATGLIDLQRYHHPNIPTPATHNRGSLTIDACLGTKLFIDALIGAWILPFGLPSTIPGNHQMLGVDFDQDILFGNKLPLPTIPSTRGVYSNDMIAVREFNDRVTEECEATQLFNRAQQLYCKYTFNEDDHDNLEDIDHILTWILVTTDKKCCKNHDSPWSPSLHKLYLMHCYWKIWLSAARTKKDYLAALTRITDKLQSSPENGKTISANIRDLWQQLREIRRTANIKRQEHLNSLLDAVQATNDTKRRKLILHLKRAEENRQCF